MKSSTNGFATPLIMIMCISLLLLATITTRELSAAISEKSEFLRSLRIVPTRITDAKIEALENSTFVRVDPFALLNANESRLILPYTEQLNRNRTKCDHEVTRTDPALTCFQRTLSRSSITALTDCHTNELELRDQTARQSNVCTDNASSRGTSIVLGYLDLRSSLTLRSDSIVIAAGDISIERINSNNHRLTLISSSGQIRVGAIVGELQLRTSAPKGVTVPANALEQLIPLDPSVLGVEILAFFS